MIDIHERYVSEVTEEYEITLEEDRNLRVQMERETRCIRPQVLPFINIYN